MTNSDLPNSDSFAIPDEDVLTALRDAGDGDWVTAGQVAMQFGGNGRWVSTALSRLCAQGKVEQRSAVPTYWRPTTVPDDTRQILMHTALVPAFEEWLASRGLELRCIGKLRDDDLPSWVVSPTDETIARSRTQESER